jgi:hypothetical protein
MGLFSRDLSHAGERGIATAASGLYGRASWGVEGGKLREVHEDAGQRLLPRVLYWDSPGLQACKTVSSRLPLHHTSVVPPSSLHLGTEGRRRDNGGMMEGQWRDQHEEAVAAAAGAGRERWQGRSGCLIAKRSAGVLECWSIGFPTTPSLQDPINPWRTRSGGRSRRRPRSRARLGCLRLRLRGRRRGRRVGALLEVYNTPVRRRAAGLG